MASFSILMKPSYSNVEVEGGARTGDPALGTPATEDLFVTFFSTQDARIEGVFLEFPPTATVKVHIVNALNFFPAIGPVGAGITNQVSDDALVATSNGDMIVASGRTLRSIGTNFPVVLHSYVVVSITGGVAGVKKALLKLTPLRGS